MTANTNKITVEIFGAFTIKTDSRDGGWKEIAVKDRHGALCCVITHPCAGAKWFVHVSGVPRAAKFATLKAAIAFAILQAQTLPAR